MLCSKIHKLLSLVYVDFELEHKTWTCINPKIVTWNNVNLHMHINIMHTQLTMQMDP